MLSLPLAATDTDAATAVVVPCAATAVACAVALCTSNAARPDTTTQLSFHCVNCGLNSPPFPVEMPRFLFSACTTCNAWSSSKHQSPCRHSNQHASVARHPPLHPLVTRPLLQVEPLEGAAERGASRDKIVTPLFALVNRNKRSLCINLKDPRGLEAFYKLVPTADVIVQVSEQ